MPVLEVSVNNFLSIVRDVESLDKLFCCSHLDCDLNSERLLISATTIDDGRNEKEETKIKAWYSSLRFVCQGSLKKRCTLFFSS